MRSAAAAAPAGGAGDPDGVVGVLDAAWCHEGECEPSRRASLWPPGQRSRGGPPTDRRGSVPAMRALRLSAWGSTPDLVRQPVGTGHHGVASAATQLGEGTPPCEAPGRACGRVNGRTHDPRPRLGPGRRAARSACRSARRRWPGPPMSAIARTRTSVCRAPALGLGGVGELGRRSPGGQAERSHRGTLPRLSVGGPPRDRWPAAKGLPCATAHTRLMTPRRIEHAHDPVWITWRTCWGQRQLLIASPGRRLSPPPARAAWASGSGFVRRRSGPRTV